MTSSPDSRHNSTVVNTDLRADFSSDSDDDDILHYVVFPKINSSQCKEKRKNEEKFLSDEAVAFAEEADRENQKKLGDIEKIGEPNDNDLLIELANNALANCYDFFNF